MRILTTLSAYFVIVACGPVMAQQRTFADFDVSELIGFLTYKIDRVHRANYDSGTFGCGQSVSDFKAAVALREHGESAIRQIEAELVRLSKDKSDRRGWYWIVSAYATVKRDQAIPFLADLAAKASESGLDHYDLDHAIAISLRLTSFVSTAWPLSANIPCLRGTQPRDALDRVIVGVLKGNRNWAESGVNIGQVGYGQEAWNRIAIAAGLGMTPAKQIERTQAIGYKFAGNDSWSDVPVSLDEPMNERVLRPEAGEERFFIQTQFVDAAGKPCAEMSVRFSKNRDRDSYRIYLVDQDDISEVIDIIRRCAR